MAETESSSGGSGWLGFLAGIIVVGLIGFAVYAYSGNQPQRTAQLDITMPNVKVNPPDVHLPAPPAPATPPSAPAQNP